jgi:uncharacterized alpha-E superfamily protein
MLSRVAENLYWISRYVERAEGVARLLEDAYSIELETGAQGSGTGPLDSVLLMLKAQNAFARSRYAAQKAADGSFSRSLSESRESIVWFLTFNRGGGVSIRETIGYARENARATQETVSGEAWSQLNKLYLFLNSANAEKRFSASPSRYLSRIRRECLLFSALIDDTLPRAEAYHFLQLGRYLERVDMLSRALNVHCHADSAQITASASDGTEEALASTPWASLLRGTFAYESYLKQSRERIDPVGVVRYLLLEADFPRSMRFGIGRCLDSLRSIAGGTGYGAAAERHLGQLDSELRYMDVEDLFQRGIGSFLVGVQDTCSAAAHEVHLAYFRIESGIHRSPRQPHGTAGSV